MQLIGNIAAKGGCMSVNKEFARKELYDLAWLKPMTKLAKQFGLSDAGLQKICAKHRIPTRPLGFWAKLQFGKASKQIPLPPLISFELSWIPDRLEGVGQFSFRDAACRDGS